MYIVNNVTNEVLGLNFLTAIFNFALSATIAISAATYDNYLYIHRRTN